MAFAIDELVIAGSRVGSSVCSSITKAGVVVDDDGGTPKVIGSLVLLDEPPTCRSRCDSI